MSERPSIFTEEFTVRPGADGTFIVWQGHDRGIGTGWGFTGISALMRFLDQEAKKPMPIDMDTLERLS